MHDAYRPYRQVTFFVVACCESITLFELERAQIHEPSETLKRLCHAQPSAAATHLLTLSPTFVLSVLLMCGVGLLRMWCYRTLGRFFTFDVAILDGHVLTTSGPYSYVRHPSYTGTAKLLLGTFLEFVGPRSYLRVCNLTNTAPVRALSICIPLAIYSVVSLYKRTLVEDRRLKAEFGKDWEAYLEAVPCRLIPYVL